jgi:hypothetical protein
MNNYFVFIAIGLSLFSKSKKDRLFFILLCTISFVFNLEISGDFLVYYSMLILSFLVFYE